MFILDDADPILKLRHETKIMRISNSIVRTQRIIFSEQFTERIEVLAEKMLVEPFEFDFDEEDEDEDEDEDFEEDENFEADEEDDFEEQEGDEENGNK